jgi:hypothetical protein
MENETELVAAYYGELYQSAKTQIDLINEDILARKDIGFKNAEECAAWAKDHLLDKLVYSSSQHQFMHMTNIGEPVTLSAWKKMYSYDVLYWLYYEQGLTEPKKIPWWPQGISYHNQARILAEETNNLRLPIFHRDYFTPKGFFDKTTDTFNMAMPFPAFAKETGRDTSHIYIFLQAIAGECYQHLLAWLRYKSMYPKLKTEIIPVIVSRTQGNGKTTFAEVICKGLFGEQNVLVTDQYDANSRFNADYADALIICAEEKEEDDRRASAASLKSRSTGTRVRKENKGLDPIYQQSYTEFIITTNKDVPIKFEGSEDQRRFMVMGSDPSFTRKTSTLADEVFTKLYGTDQSKHKTGVPFVEDKELISQFKHELFQNKDLANVNLSSFPRTEEYHRCFSLPRTTENTEIDSILRSIAPFIKQSLLERKVVQQISGIGDQVLSLTSFTASAAALQFMPEIGGTPAYVAVCKPLVFCDQQTGKPFNHSVVERGILDCTPWLVAEYGLRLMGTQLPLPGGFQNVLTRYRNAPAVRFMLVCEEETLVNDYVMPIRREIIKTDRIGERLRVNGQWKPDPEGEYETVNEMKPGVTSLVNKTNNVQYMDNFLFEADDTDRHTYLIEKSRLSPSVPKNAASVFMERLRLQKAESERLLNEGIAWRVVYSGGKSYHILVRVKDSPSNIDEYRWLHAHLCNGIISKKLDFDMSCNDPARLTRAPIEHERIFKYNDCTIVGIQALYREMPNQVMDYNWRPLYAQWQNRPLEPYELNGRKLRPAKQEYKDAMWALLNGTFFIDSAWNGRRQLCFFPAYRLCRLLGFSHDQLWCDEGILDGLSKYYRKAEIPYWRSRETSDIIKQIDEDVTLQLEDEDNG